MGNEMETAKLFALHANANRKTTAKNFVLHANANNSTQHAHIKYVNVTIFK